MLALETDVPEEYAPVCQIRIQLFDLDLGEVDVVLDGLLGEAGLELWREDNVLVSAR